jgi:hypothetical protein
MTNKKSVGYTGSTPISAGAFYVPYIPLQVYINPYKLTWRNYLQNMANNLEGCETSEIIALVWKKMQDQYPGAYSVVIDSELTDDPIFKTRYGAVSVKQVRLRLDFANPADETWWRLQYD